MSGVSPLYLLKFITDQLFLRLPTPNASFKDQTIIVTGSNVGLGLEAARHFTRLGAAKVILAVRNQEKGNAAKQSIEESTKTQGMGIVEVWPLDLSSYGSVKEFAARASKLERLDVLLENAGLATDKYEVFEDNESTITVNVISTFLLALLLLPKLRETGRKYNPPRPPHLIIVSSEVHYFSALPEQSAPEGQILATLNDKSTANMADRYNVSKLLEVFFTRELASRSPTEKGGVIINFLNPGLCHSELGRNAGWGMWLMKAMFARTTEQGSRTLVHASQAGEESHGQYMSNCDVADVAPMVQKDGKEGGGKLQKRVWDEITTTLEKIQPGVTKNV
jgi:retinol dehydrogenase 12